MKYKVLNCYAGIGGNRKLWKDVEVTAVELNLEIAKIYQDFFPDDKVIVGDAHQYLLDHYKEFDFIWSSPPCPTHSVMRKTLSIPMGAEVKYPDMKLYEEIILLQNFFSGDWAVENVVSYYKPLIPPYKVHRHYVWSNIYIPEAKFSKGSINISIREDRYTTDELIEQLSKDYGFDVSGYNGSKTKLLTYLRNCVIPEMGNYILNCARDYTEPIQEGLFAEQSSN